MTDRHTHAPGPWLIQAGLDSDPFEGDGGVLATLLARHGALLMRGFGVHGPAELEARVRRIAAEPMPYLDRASRRSTVTSAVSTATDTPARYEIALHNESSFTARFPARLFFSCVRPAERGGATLLADVRRVLARLDDTLVRRFEDHGVLYVRHFGNGPGMDWRTVFQVEDEAQMRAYAAANGIEATFGSGGRLRTRQVRPAVATHPETGERLWFNHVWALNTASLEQDLRDALPAEVPHQTAYGDGTPIPAAVLEAIRAAYAAETVPVRWEAGDLLVVDNLSMAHGRESYAGDRSVLLAMTDPLGWPALGHELPTTTQLASEPLREVTPATPVEGLPLEVVLAIVAEVLELDAVAPEDDFFDLGGDSLTAGRVIARIRAELGRELSLETFFDAERLQELC